MKILWLDVETTGLEPDTHEIIELSCMLQKGNQVMEPVTFYFRPERRVDPEALKVQNKTMEQVLAYPHRQTSFETLKKFLKRFINPFDKTDKAFLAGYNVVFDEEFLRDEFKRQKDDYFGSWFYNCRLDVMGLVPIYILLNPDKPKPENHQLGTIYEYVTGKNLDDAHSSKADIIATRDICREIIATIRRTKDHGNEKASPETENTQESGKGDQAQDS